MSLDHLFGFLLLRGQDLLVVVILLILFFGAKKIPDIARGMGEGIRNFKHSVKDDEQPRT